MKSRSKLTQRAMKADHSREDVSRACAEWIHALTILLKAHQIRVHLQFLGYPIANDTVYASEKIWVR